ncbi:MAG: hypothetical protein OXM56_14535 [Gammaproteobacteria bacterium]|nr:hypothetical protein [Gammaproteobacteria bacterium]
MRLILPFFAMSWPEPIHVAVAEFGGSAELTASGTQLRQEA